MAFSGTKALNKTHCSTASDASMSGNNLAFVTVFTIYNSSVNSLADDKLSNLVTIGNTSYNKEERSMAILNVFVNFIQVLILEFLFDCICLKYG